MQRFNKLSNLFSYLFIENNEDIMRTLMAIRKVPVFFRFIFFHSINQRLAKIKSRESFLVSFISLVQTHYNESFGQFFQDLLVVFLLNSKQNGYFVEFGATNGLDINNTYLLEKKYNWTGILSEPARVWKDALHANRNCHITTDCVWTTTGESVSFNEVDAPELSTMSVYTDSDMHADERKSGVSYAVTTVSLFDLLQRHNAPRSIDYLSIDTEGSEFEILEAFDFGQYEFKVITLEHNFEAGKRKNLKMLLEKNGYKRIFETVSLYDDWYVHESLGVPN